METFIRRRISVQKKEILKTRNIVLKLDHKETSFFDRAKRKDLKKWNNLRESHAFQLQLKQKEHLCQFFVVKHTFHLQS